MFLITATEIPHEDYAFELGQDPAFEKVIKNMTFANKWAPRQSQDLAHQDATACLLLSFCLARRCSLLLRRGKNQALQGVEESRQR